MLDAVLQGLERIDRFGAIFRPPLINVQPEYKSVLGGIATLIIYGSSIAYFFYQIIQWQSNQLLPKVTHIQRAYSQKYFKIEDQLSSFYARKNYKPDQIDPFDPENLIMQPILSIFNNQQLIDSKANFTYKLSDQYNNTEIVLQGLEFYLNTDNTAQNPQIDYVLSFGFCQEMHLSIGQHCANDSLVTKYMKQYSHAIIVNNYVKQFDFLTKSISKVKKSFITILNNDTSIYLQNQISLAKTQIDDGFLFPSNTMKEYPVDLTIISQSISPFSFKNLLNQTNFLVIQYSLSEIVQEQYFEYPKISEVLADIGSIVSIILLFSYIFIFFNEIKLEKESIKKVIQIYYPEIINIKFKYTIFGTIKEVFQNSIQIDKQEFLTFYNKLTKTASKKLCVTNIIFTLAKLQFLLQSTYNQEKIQIAHKIGIKLKQFSQYQKENSLQLVKDQQPESSDISNNLSNQHLQIYDANELKKNEEIIQMKDNSIIQKVMFIQQKNNYHLLNDDDFNLFTLDELFAIDYEVLKQDPYYEGNYIDI